MVHFCILNTSKTLILKQIIDMRWGIKSELTKDNITTTLCLNEIKNSIQYSIGPNFIVTLKFKS